MFQSFVGLQLEVAKSGWNCNVSSWKPRRRPTLRQMLDFAPSCCFCANGGPVFFFPDTTKTVSVNQLSFAYGLFRSLGHLCANTCCSLFFLKYLQEGQGFCVDSFSSATKECNSLNVDDFFQPKWWIPEVEGASWHIFDLTRMGWDDWM